jgi:hypothetical protein
MRIDNKNETSKSEVEPLVAFIELARTTLGWIGAMYCLSLLLSHFEVFARTHPSINPYFAIIVGIAFTTSGLLSRALSQRLLKGKLGAQK